MERTTTQQTVQQLFPPPPRYYVDACPPTGCVLEPPPLPQESYQVFGEVYSVETGLPLLQVSQEFKRNEDGSLDVKKELLELYTRLVECINEVIETLAKEPSQYARGVERLGVLFRNMQYLTNLLRPVQARHTLDNVLERRAGRLQAIIDTLSELSSTSSLGLDDEHPDHERMTDSQTD